MQTPTKRRVLQPGQKRKSKVKETDLMLTLENFKVWQFSLSQFRRDTL